MIYSQKLLGVVLMSDKPYLTVQEVARKMHVTDQTVIRWIKAKRLSATKVGNWRIAPSDLQAFIKQGKK